MARTKKKKEPMKTIKISEARYYDLINRVNSLDRIVDSIKEMNDMYLSDLNTLDIIKYKFVHALDLEWNNDNHRYEPPKGEKL
jgi:hypothetical protein|tara:strand:+ start:57 stop:305 length:249 start_codon:yes stop_codon:yes gene_type:complete